jgi:hypothetical protein
MVNVVEVDDDELEGGSGEPTTSMAAGAAEPLAPDFE